ncbi:hypothetical protein YERSI8AC_100221 [Enterobacterales bacterium 8AC]|nr:hypothetical protein YERSI8AC_100221 [Enterobacterales bacterium 8AC]
MGASLHVSWLTWYQYDLDALVSGADQNLKKDNEFEIRISAVKSEPERLAKRRSATHRLPGADR